MDKKIIIFSKLNTYFNKNNSKRYQNEINEDWLKYRIDLFKNYCLKSIINQTNQYFTFLLQCRQETMPFIQKTMGDLPENILLINPTDFHKKIYELSQDYQYLYLARVDSDDMWIKYFVDTLHNYYHKKETEILINQKCYNYDIYSGRLASFFYKSPQSYVMIYKPEEYKKGFRYTLKRGHGGAILLNHEILEGYNYMDTVHNENILKVFKQNNWENWEEIKDSEKIKSILREFGINK